MIGGGAEGGRGVFSEKQPIDIIARMLYAKTDAERARTQRHAGVPQQAYGVLSAVPRGEEGGAGRDLPFALRRVIPDADKFSVAKKNPVRLRPEDDLSAEGENLLPQATDDARETVGAEVRIFRVADLFGRAGENEFVQHFRAVGVVLPELQFPVREGTRAPFSVLDVALGIGSRTGKKAVDAPFSLLHALAPLQKNRARPRLGESQSAKQPCGARPDDHGAKIRVPRRRCVDEGGVGKDGLAHFEKSSLPLFGRGKRDGETLSVLPFGKDPFFFQNPYRKNLLPTDRQSVENPRVNVLRPIPDGAENIDAYRLPHLLFLFIV